MRKEQGNRGTSEETGEGSLRTRGQVRRTGEVGQVDR